MSESARNLRNARRLLSVRRLVRPVLLIAGPLAVLAVGAYFYATSGRYVSTDNAYVKADKYEISSEISGRVAEVFVRENQAVTLGQILFRLDVEPLEIAVARGEAVMRMVESDLMALRASYQQKREELELAGTDLEYAAREFGRQAQLADRQIASEAKLDEARHARDRARQQIAVITEDLARIRASLGNALAGSVNGHPRYLEAKAARDEAALDLTRATVRAPAAGIVTQGNIDTGEYIVAGEPVMSLVATDGLWIQANFKETELTHVRPGQPLTVHVDTYPGEEWPGRVQSIGQATGAEFSLLPAQNATGNWVKVVQRIPVRVMLEISPDDPPLRAGMSTEVVIDTGRQSRLPQFVRWPLERAGLKPEISEARAGESR